MESAIRHNMLSVSATSLGLAITVSFCNSNPFPFLKDMEWHPTLPAHGVVAFSTRRTTIATISNVLRMTNDCQLEHWMTNSRIEHAVSRSGSTGPYQFQDIVIKTWSHNLAPLQLPNGIYKQWDFTLVAPLDVEDQQ
jgi:hypothetical protein